MTVDAETLTAIAANIVALGGILAIIVNKLDATHKKTATKIANITDKLDHETNPNHGTSLKDALNRIEASQRGMQRDIGRLADMDVEMAHAKAKEHDRIWTAIQEIKENK